MLTGRESFQGQIEAMQRKVTDLASFVMQMLARAMRALTEQDAELADEVIWEDDVADDLDLEIERDCMRLLALQQVRASVARLTEACAGAPNLPQQIE